MADNQIQPTRTGDTRLVGQFSAWFRRLSLPSRVFASVLGLGGLFAFGSFFFSQFTQARNIVNNLGYSRVMLAGLYVVLVSMFLVVLCQEFNKWISITLSVTVPLLIVFGLDWWAPKPKIVAATIVPTAPSSNPTLPIPTSTPAPPKESPKKQELANLVFEFYGKVAPYFNMLNTSRSETAYDPKYWFGLWDVDNPWYLSGIATHQVLRIPTKLLSGDYIHPLDRIGYQEVIDTPDAKKYLRNGDRIFGFAGVTCRNCKTTWFYFVFFRIGTGGWYAQETQAYFTAHSLVPDLTGSTQQVMDTALDSLIPSTNRTTMPELNPAGPR